MFGAMHRDIANRALQKKNGSPAFGVRRRCTLRGLGAVSEAGCGFAREPSVSAAMILKRSIELQVTDGSIAPALLRFYGDRILVRHS